MKEYSRTFKFPTNFEEKLVTYLESLKYMVRTEIPEVLGKKPTCLQVSDGTRLVGEIRRGKYSPELKSFWIIQTRKTN